MLIGVDAGADALLAAGTQPDIVVVSARSRQAGDRVSAKALRGARDVVLLVDRGDRQDPDRSRSSGSASARTTSRPAPPPRTSR